VSVQFYNLYILFNAFNLNDVSYIYYLDACDYLFQHNLSYTDWSFEMATLRSVYRFIREGYFALMAAPAEKPVSHR
jgi:hypothetical protein